jgi:hypothetical protein
MSILASRAARRAWSRVRATTAKSVCPWNITSWSTNKGSSAKTGATSFLPGISAAVRTTTTPGAPRTASKPKLFNLPEVLVAMPIAICSVPAGSPMSSM